MPETGQPLRTVLDGYAKSLREEDLAHSKTHPASPRENLVSP